jgi:hypothetical protein
MSANKDTFLAQILKESRKFPLSDHNLTDMFNRDPLWRLHDLRERRARIDDPLRNSHSSTCLEIINKDFSRFQRDGFGFYAQGNGGKAYGRYLDPSDYFGHGVSMPDFLKPSPSWEAGRMPDIVTNLIAHGRTSTNVTILKNVHPFKAGSLVLAHNGILFWEGKKEDEPKSAAGCDSEQFLNWLASGGQWQDAHKVWAGWGAMLLLDLASRCLTLAKDGTTKLHGAKRSRGGWVLSTEPDLIKRLSKVIKLRSKPIPFPQRIVHFDQAGEIIKDVEWLGFGNRNYMFERSIGGSAPKQPFPDYDPQTDGTWPSLD